MVEISNLLNIFRRFTTTSFLSGFLSIALIIFIKNLLIFVEQVEPSNSPSCLMTGHMNM